MRKLSRNDEGVTMVLTVVLMTILLGCVGLAIDVGTASASVRAVQNSADAAALAAANDCARGNSTSHRDVEFWYGNNAQATCIMSTGTATASATKTIDRFFGTQQTTAYREATAKWSPSGLLKATTVMPIIIAACEFPLNHIDDTDQITLYLDDPNPHTGCESPSGGFGRLEPSSGECTVTPALVGGVWTLEGKTGNDLEKLRDCLPARLNTPTLVPLYDDASCGGRCQGGMQYPIKGYAEIVLTGYLIKKVKSSPSVTCNNDCIIGDFVRFILPNNLPNVVVGGPDFGAVRAYLSS